MAIIDIKPMWTGNESDAVADEDLSITSRRRHDRLAWSILSDDPAGDTSVSIQQEAAETYDYNVGIDHPTDGQLKANSIRVNRISPIMFILEAAYVAKGSEPGQNPLDEPPQIESDHASSIEAIDRDINGDVIMTVNGERFDPPVTEEINDLVLTVSRNVAAWDYLLAWSYMGGGQRPAASNSDTFLGFPPGSARIRRLFARSVTSEDFVYFRATGVVQFRNAAPGSTVAKAWWKRILHQGFRVKRDDPLNPGQTIIDHHTIEGERVTSPVLLKADGTIEPDKANAHWLEFQTGPSLAFSALGIFN